MITTEHGEVLNLTPFSEHLRTLSAGSLNAELTERLAEVIKRVRETGKAGGVSLTIKVAMLNDRDENAVKLIPNVSTKMPAFKPYEAVMYSTADGDLQRDDPRQRKLDLKEVHKDRPAPIDLPVKAGQSTETVQTA